jgi:steroid 5-alpha reductase family enzyme
MIDINYLGLIINYTIALSAFESFVRLLDITYTFSIFFYSIIFLISHLLKSFPNDLNYGIIIGCVEALLWSIRLGSFVVSRNILNKDYKKIKADLKKKYNVPILMVFVLYLVTPSLYHFCSAPFRISYNNHYNNLIKENRLNIIDFISVSFFIIGWVLEAVSDNQKNEFKNKNPNLFCDVFNFFFFVLNFFFNFFFFKIGLFKISRHPNYFGEIAMWTAMWIEGLKGYVFWYDYIYSFMEVVIIYWVMIGMTKRIEKSQFERYKNDSKYLEYYKNVPVLVPFIPVYEFDGVKDIDEKKK